MKKAYKAPVSEAFALQTEGLIAASLSKSGSVSVGGGSALSNRKSGWSSSNWSNTGD